ncbi:hypothetical protein OSB04_018543 [Centaurea solstitialis]|uniref:Uncharacterized protein n=1 Tax=Centaurea solstitialis TaxID=347529 RepID=A0AA38TPY8_9ASTR|nr:hypothetical protein OSB04_018543 [Centaurea solstitialis]
MIPIYNTLVISVTLLLPISIFSLTECDFPAIFNFGDSNSDTGGLSAMFGQAPPPNGETFFHSPAGRYCDGRLLLDFIAEHLELPFLSPFLDSIGTNFSHGANFATAGSTIRRQNTSIFQSGYSPIALAIQYAEFSNFYTRSQIIRQREDFYKNLFPQKDKFSKALYTFDIGQNDLTAGYKLNMSTEQVEAFVPDVISQFITTVKPADLDKFGCATAFNDVSHYFNKKLKKAVIELRKELESAAITYVDIYSVKYSLIGKAKELGFDDPFLVCCGHGGRYNFNNARRCGATEIVDGKEILIAGSCEHPSSRILWDGIHFSEAANRWIYGQIAKGEFSDPPVPLKLACHKGEVKAMESNHYQGLKL